MAVEWLRFEDEELLTNILNRYPKLMADTDRSLASCDEGSRAYLLDTRRGNAHWYAVAMLLMNEDTKTARYYLHQAGESGEEQLTYRGTETESLLVSSGELDLEKQNDGEWELMEQRPDSLMEEYAEEIAKEYEGRVVDTGEGKGIVFVDDSGMGAGSSINAMECSLASGDVDLAERVARLACGPRDFIWEGEITCWYARVLKHAILSDKAALEESIGKLREVEDNEDVHTDIADTYRGLADVYQAFMLGDRGAPEDAFRRYMEGFRRKRKPKRSQFYSTTLKKQTHYKLLPVELLMSMSGVAFCNLAASRGMVLEIDEPLVPSTLLISNTDSDTLRKSWTEPPTPPTPPSEDKPRSWGIWPFRGNRNTG